MFDLKNTVNRIEVVNDNEDGYWTVGSIELFDEDGDDVDVNIDYTQINRPFENSDEMLERVADYFGVDASIVSLYD